MTRHGDWFLTYSGIQFFPMDPRPEEVQLIDIAHALSRICRYGGHCLDWYSVAQHSVMVSHLVPTAFALEGLLHDAEEAYTGDMIRPIKHGLRERTDAFDVMADTLKTTIRIALGLPEIMTADADAAVHAADNHALSTERRDLVRDTGREWRVSREFPPIAQKIEPMERDAAKAVFFTRFLELTRKST